MRDNMVSYYNADNLPAWIYKHYVLGNRTHLLRNGFPKFGKTWKTNVKLLEDLFDKILASSNVIVDLKRVPTSGIKFE